MAITSIIQSHFVADKISRSDLRSESNTLILGKPNFKLFINKLVIRIPYFMNPNSMLVLPLVLKENQIKSLGTALQTYLSHYFAMNNAAEKAQVLNIELRFIRLQYPYLDSYILSQYIAINAGKYNFNRMQKILFRGITDTREIQPGVLPRVITGVKLELAGRLTTQRSIPRKTISNAHTGSFSLSKSQKLNPSLNMSQYTSKNKLGTFTMKV